MREVGRVSTKGDAEKLLKIIENIGGEGDVRSNSEGGYTVWVFDEAILDDARQLFREFSRNPENLKEPAPETPPENEMSVKERVKTPEVLEKPFQLSSPQEGVPLTLSLIAASVIIFIFAESGESNIKNLFYFSQYMGKSFPEIREGQIWRIFTPVLLHGGFLHILFNMLWLNDLGSQIERQKGTVYFGIFFLVLAATCNTGQYLVSGPAFLGMSGVVYGVFGFVWMMKKYSTSESYHLSEGVAPILLIWYFLCLFGVIPGVANTEHTIGLVMGVVWGFLASGGYSTYQRKKKVEERP